MDKEKHEIISEATLQQIQNLANEYNIENSSLTVTKSGIVHSMRFGEKQQSEQRFFQIASLSKTVCSLFALEYFKKKNISFESSLNALPSLLPEYSAKLEPVISRLKLPDSLLLKNLINHTAMNMHYVRGKHFPKYTNLKEILKEINLHDNILASKAKPGEQFHYSGGGFLLLQLLIETMEETEAENLVNEFLKSRKLHAGLIFPNREFAATESPLGGQCAQGFQDDNQPIEGKRLHFAAFAAGGWGTSAGMSLFLEEMKLAYENVDHDWHESVCIMVNGQDNGSVDFMGCLMGLGVFTIEAGNSVFLVHQGANDGFRAIFLHCFKGVHAGSGLSFFVNKDNKGMLFIARSVSKILLSEELFANGSIGINFNVLNSMNEFNFSEIPQEQIVNLGYKKLLFDAFEVVQPPHIKRGSNSKKHKLSEFKIDLKIEKVSNERFARAENLISEFEPEFDPNLFCSMGKVMDSWESGRHNQKKFDFVVFIPEEELSQVSFLYVSTKFHLGNQAEFFSLDGWIQNNWVEIVPKVVLVGHSELSLKFSEEQKQKLVHSKRLRFCNYPDGGISRFYLLKKVVEKHEDMVYSKYNDLIPTPNKPLTAARSFTMSEIRENVENLEKTGSVFDALSQKFGAEVLEASNEHYSPARNLISPDSPISMYDGFESARSREADHFEYAILKTFKPIELGKMEFMEFDFTFFVNNTPMFISVDISENKNNFITLKEKVPVKHFAGNKMRLNFETKKDVMVSFVKVRIFPDGGINRIRLICKNSTKKLKPN
eukprot:snap_masked-scaffold_32-processed-gene-1.24-mRNA-1 protein AED:1.00 eAED:1.00 QI:0/-1/0/0/-1/1/1/0/772